MRARSSSVVVLALALVFVGSLQVLPLTSQVSVDPEATEVPFGALAAGATVGANATNATVSLDGLTLLTTTDLLYLNNTNASGAWYAKLVLTGSNRITNLVTLRVGIQNATASTDQIVALAGSLTQSEGSYVLLTPGSVNRVYLTQLVTNPALSSRVDVDVYVSSTAAGTDQVVTKATFTLV